MLMLVSPAKTLDYETPAPINEHTLPDMLEQSHALIKELKQLTPKDVASLMKLSDKLADLNVSRFQHWSLPFTQQNAKQAIYAFKGDVYTGLDAYNFSKSDMNFAQKHLRMLSGLYGLLRPMDLIQPYRLEMGTKFENHKGKNLYEFWGNQITDKINQEPNGSDVIVNLASNEYFKSVKTKQLKAKIITPVFKDEKNGQFKIISFYAKKARGLMSAYIIKQRIKDVENIKKFDVDGYYFSPDQSNDCEWVFLRKEQK
ncbi:peroxide stress protein YaaA [Oceaniserpentilla sp. 4NH20-0058]|uniref:peroxide stress protein YaaA n=1 Tax=Oceaniserpentilla sp. 4NH20-0058 TaxID=3127660 RepID=UPI0031070BB3